MTTVIRDGLVVDEAGAQYVDLVIEEGRIRSLEARGSVQAGTVIDADGLVVLPGLVDPHVHVRDPGLTHKEDFATATAAAAAGGVTTIMVMPYDVPVADSAPRLAEKAAAAEGRVSVDVALQAAVGRANVSDLRDFPQAGVVSAELLLEAPPGLPTVENYGELRSVLIAAQAAGVVVGITCEVVELVAARTAEFKAAGRDDMEAFLDARSPAGELIGVTAACSLAEETGASIHIRQVSLARAVDIIEFHRERGADISFEVTPHNLALSREDAVKGGPRLKIVPALRAEAEPRQLRDLLRSGRVDMIATDHSPHSPEEKDDEAADIWTVPGGFPGLETMLPVVAKLASGDWPLVARVCAAAPARRFGFGSSRGRLLPGFRADVTLFDPTSSQGKGAGPVFSKAGYRAFTSAQLQGQVVRTILGGKTIFEHGRLVDEPRGRVVRPARIASHSAVRNS